MSKELKKWMPIFWGDYFRGTQQFTNATEHGAYMLLIAYCWHNGALPKDDDARRRIAKCTPRQWSLIRDLVSSKFDDEGRNERCDKEIAYAIEKSRRLSPQARLKLGLTDPKSDLKSPCRDTPTPTPTPTPTKKERKINPGNSPRLLPGDWTISASHYELGKNLGLEEGEIGEAAAEMRDWSIGSGKRKSNWDSTFNNWLRRNAAAKKGSRRATTGGNVILAADRLKEKIAEFNRPSRVGPPRIGGAATGSGRGGICGDSGENIVRLLPDGGRE